MLEAQWAKGNFDCVGLDSEFSRIPKSAWVGVSVVDTVVGFNRAIVEATRDIVCAYSLNTAFYEVHGGEEGMLALQRTITHIHALAPDVPVIVDAKRGDVGNINKGYASAAFDILHADAITVHPYLGIQALKPFLARAEKGVIVLCRTSNPGAGEFQDLLVDGEPLYRFVARRVANEWNKAGNCGLVVGATHPSELYGIREIVGDVLIFIPDVDARSGDVQISVSAGKDSRGQGIIVHCAHDIIFASKGADFAEAARREAKKLRDLIINQ
jgi:orotidine-5'-phosphate decarboxylase